MRYDPAVRIAKYDSVAAPLRREGFRVSVSTESRLVDGMGIQHPDFKDFSLSVAARIRGWFLFIPRPGMQMAAVFRVPHHSLIPSLLSSMLHERISILNQPSEFIEKKFGLENVPYSMWGVEEDQEDWERWSHFGWHIIAEEELQRISPEYEAHFFPDGVLCLPSPYASWHFGLGNQDSIDLNEDLEMSLTMHTLRSFQLCVPKAEVLLVLDWQHTCYYFDVHCGITKAYRDEWAKPILLPSEDIIYLSRDFQIGLMSLRDGAFHVFGRALLDAFVRDLPASGPFTGWR
jgi:hypothetical protein